MKKILIAFTVALTMSCNIQQTIPDSCKACIDSILPIIIDSLTMQAELQVERSMLQSRPDINPKVILHVIALNAGKGRGHAFVMTLPENYLTDTSFSGKLTRQLKYMNQQANHKAEYPSKNYPNDTFFVNGQGDIWELWIAQTQDQIKAGSKDWIENTCDRNYAPHTLEMENARGRKLIYPNM